MICLFLTYVVFPHVFHVFKITFYVSYLSLENKAADKNDGKCGEYDDDDDGTALCHSSKNICVEHTQ